VSEGVRYRCEVTRELVSRATPQLEELFAWWVDRAREGAERRRRLRPELLRWLGLGVSLLGIAVAAFAIVITPDAPRCGPAGSRVVFYDGMMPLFVVAATFFGFLPRISPAIHAWARRAGARQARGLAARLGPAAPFDAEYEVEGGRITARVEKLRLVRATELARVERAAFAADVALLQGGRFPRYVKRVLWLPEDPGARKALRAALAAAGVAMADLPLAAPAPPPP
jgi:hypothetical protein